MPGVRRSFLLLQGVCSPFFAKLADRLVADGHRVTKIHFNAGDVAYWWPRKALHFRGPVDGLAEFLDEVYARHEITDQVLFGDRRPVHRPAVSHGEARDVRTHVFEEGYFRPYWITLEREGVNGHSLLPRDPDWFWEASARMGESLPVQAFSSPFRTRASHDVAYHLAGSLNPLFFPKYKSHAPVNAAVEYAGYVRRLPMLRLYRRLEAGRMAKLLMSRTPYFVLPLQLSSDAQIRDHSRFENMSEGIEFVMGSFALHAPNDSHLVIKNHPLDMWLTDYRRLIRQLSAQLGLGGRVHYLETGHLEKMLSHARGTVTVNSTVGGVALELGCPTIALSDPIYNLPGLTFQGTLDAFWSETPLPDLELFRRFRQVVMYATQVNGGFYCAKGIDLAVRNSQRWLEQARSPLEALL